VIFFDCPDFYNIYLPSLIDNFKPEEYLIKDTQNAGRNYGIVVKTIDELIDAINYNLHTPIKMSSEKHQNLKLKLIDNPGNASRIAFCKIQDILKGNALLLRFRDLLFLQKKMKSGCQKIRRLYSSK
jgi:hypothetical protein